MSKMKITKIEATRIQIETAIYLFFKSGDPISIHTLIQAAYNILEPICKIYGKKNIPIVKGRTFIRPEKYDDYLKIVNKAYNFFKHSAKDMNETLDFNPDCNDFFIYDVCQMYDEVALKKTAYIKIFRVWFLLRYSECLKADNEENKEFKRTIELIGIHLDPLNKYQFLTLIGLIKI